MAITPIYSFQDFARLHMTTSKALGKRPVSQRPSAFDVLLNRARCERATSSPASDPARRPPFSETRGGDGSRFIECPCCGEQIHRALIGSHLECCPGGVAAAPPFAAAAAASQNSAASSVASEVACPSCGSYFPTEAAVFAHLDVCPGAREAEDADSCRERESGCASSGDCQSSSSGDGGSTGGDPRVSCPACGVCVQLSKLNSHPTQPPRR